MKIDKYYITKLQSMSIDTEKFHTKEEDEIDSFFLLSPKILSLYTAIRIRRTQVR